jgi:phosphatidylglycerol:prolipoprotein diacylglycerol transferase
MVFPQSGTSLPRHPSQLYELLLEGVLLFIVLWLYARKPRPRLAVSGVFALGYGCARFFTEYFRTPDYEVHFAGITISAGQMLSLPMIVLGLVLLFIAYHRQGRAAPSAA